MSLEALFVPAGDSAFDPTELSRGPWRPDAQHGGPPSALLAHVTEPLVEPAEFVSAMDVELVRPVPLARLVASVERVRVSGRVWRVNATLASEDEVVAISSARCLRTADLDEPDWTPERVVAVDPPDPTHRVEAPRWASGDVTTYHRNAVEHRFTMGTFREAGPAVDWVRLRQPVVAGHEPSGLERCLAAADFGSGVSAVYGAQAKTGLINVNLAVTFIRPFVGEWVSLDAMTHVGPQGTGLGVTELGDTDGLVGVATQCLLGYNLR